MPTPIVHTGLALALALAGAANGPGPSLRLPTGREHAVRALVLVGLANAADVDFLPGLLAGRAVAFHHGATHSVVFAVGMAVLAWLCWAARYPDGGSAPGHRWPHRQIGALPWLGLTLVAALSHPLLDWLTGEPAADVQRHGIEAFWPASPTRYMSDWHAFGAYPIDRLGLVGGVFTGGAIGNLAREAGFALGSVAIAGVIRWARGR